MQGHRRQRRPTALDRPIGILVAPDHLGQLQLLVGQSAVNAGHHRQARQLAVDWCARGGNVQYQPYLQLPAGTAGINHIGPFLADVPVSQQWVVDRLNGRPAFSNCGLLPILR